MAAFIVATVKITDLAKFKEYGAAIAGVSEEFGGSYIVRGAVTEMLEGQGTIGERVVILQFPDADAARRFYNSARYQTGKALRIGAAEVTMRLVEA